LGAGLPEFWIEYYIYLPNGNEGFGSAKFVTRQPEGCTSNNTNLKVFRMWGESYSNPTDQKVGLDIWKGDEKLRTSAGWTGRGLGQYGGALNNFVSDAYRGRWVQIRLHARVADSQEASNGVIQAWVDGVLFSDLDDVPLASEGNDPRTGEPLVRYFRKGYLMGWANAGFDEETYVFIDDLRVYGSDPGWK
jgi:hypothetical protein